VPYILGILAAICIKGMRWALVAHVIMLVILADVAYAVVLRKLWVAVFPWSVIDRVISIQWFVVPLLMTWGVFHLRQTLNLREAMARRPIGRLLVVVFVGAAIATPAVGAYHEATRIRDAVRGEDVTSDADVAAFAQMDRVLAPGTIVLTQGHFDYGQWIDAMTRDVEWAPLAYWRGVIENGVVPLLDDRARALGHACSDPDGAVAALRGIGAIYVGGMVVDGSPAPWNTACIAALPGVREVVTATVDGHTARVFAVSAAH
jgi:hypothetical protein